MEFLPTITIDNLGILRSKKFFPSLWMKELGLEEGEPIPRAICRYIEDFKKDQSTGQGFSFGTRKVALIVEPSDEKYHISFDLKSKRTDRERNKSLDRYQLLVEAANDVIFEIDTSGRFQYMNPAAIELSCYRAEELIGKRFLKLVRPDWHEKVSEFYFQQLKDTVTSTYLEFPAVNAHGKEIWLGQQVQLLEDEEGIVGMMAVARDITEKRIAERLLKQSEEKYRGIIDNLQYGLMEVDLDERIVYVNDPMCQISGYAREELIGQVASDVLVSTEAREVIDDQNSSREEGVAGVYEIQLRQKNGQPIWALISGAPMYDAHGNHCGSIGIHMDITGKKREELRQRKLAEKLALRNGELQEKQRFLNAINHFVTKLLEQEDIASIAWEIAENVIEEFGFEDCVIYVVNKEEQKLEQLAAFGPKMSKNRQILDPIDIKMGEGIVGSVAQTGEAEIVSDTSMDSRYIADDIFRLSELAVPIIAEGEVIGVIDSEHPDANFFSQEHLETLRTVANLAANRLKNAQLKAAQLEAEEELRDSEKKLRSIIQSALDGVITIDARGVVTEWNHQAEVIFGYTAKEAIGKSLTETIIPKQHHQAHDQGMRHYLATGQGPVLNQKIEITAIRKSGEEFPIELAIIPVVMKGVHSFTAFVSDITVQKQVQAEMEKALTKERELNELKSRFVSMTSHEFRTPLTTIKQNVDLVSFKIENQNPENFESYQKFFNRIESEIGRVTMLMNDILMLGRIESGKVEIKKRKVDLQKHLVKIIDQQTQSRVDGRGIQLTVTGVPQPVQLDLQLIDHVLLNLISNAFKYSEGKQDPEIELKYDSLERVALNIKDYGIGIPKKDQKGLFQSFYRATNVKNIQGSGLGLSIVKEFIELHGGIIKVESSAGQGCTFLVELPYQ